MCNPKLCDSILSAAGWLATAGNLWSKIDSKRIIWPVHPAVQTQATPAWQVVQIHAESCRFFPPRGKELRWFSSILKERASQNLLQDGSGFNQLKTFIIRDPGHLGWQPTNLPFAGEAARRGRLNFALSCHLLQIWHPKGFFRCNSWNAFGQVLLTPAEPLPLQSWRIMDDSLDPW